MAINIRITKSILLKIFIPFIHFGHLLINWIFIFRFPTTSEDITKESEDSSMQYFEYNHMVIEKNL